jgi:hypothetical protein
MMQRKYMVLILHVNATSSCQCHISNHDEQAAKVQGLAWHAKKVPPNMGDLQTNHSLAIMMSSLGMLPLWICEHAEISPASRYMKRFSTKFPLPKRWILETQAG